MKQWFVAGTVALSMSAAPAFAQDSPRTQNPQPGQSGSGGTRQPGGATDQGGSQQGGSSQGGSSTQGTSGSQGASGAQGTSGSQAKSQSQSHAGHQFAMDAAHINMAEIEMGKLAQQKGQSQQVKDFGQRLEDDHGKALNELKDIAGAKNITLPREIDAKHKATYDKLSKLSGQQFDRMFAQEMVTGHKEALQKAQSAAKSESDPQLKAFASKMVTSVQAHLKQAQSLASGAVGTSGSQQNQDNNDRQPNTRGAGQGGTGTTPGGTTSQPGNTPGSSNQGGAPGSQGGSDRR